MSYFQDNARTWNKASSSRVRAASERTNEDFFDSSGSGGTRSTPGTIPAIEGQQAICPYPAKCSILPVRDVTFALFGCDA